MTALEHLRAAETWAGWAEECYRTGTPAELPAAQVCASIGQLHLGLATTIARLTPDSQTGGGEPR